MRAAKVDANQGEIVLPWPPKELSPNARVHWATKARKAKAYRAECRLLTLMAGASAPEGLAVLALEFVAPDRRARDDDNLVAAFKAGRDGIAEALGVDDRRFVTEFRMSGETTPGGMVKVTIREAT